MTIEELIAEWSKDSKINAGYLHEEALNVSTIHAKYITLYLRDRVQLLKLRTKKASLYKDLYDYYSGKMLLSECKEKFNRELWLHESKVRPLELIKTWIEADELYIELILKIGILEEKLNYLDNIIRSLSSRGFAIKNSIDFLKYKEGKA